MCKACMRQVRMANDVWERTECMRQVRIASDAWGSSLLRAGCYQGERLREGHPPCPGRVQWDADQPHTDHQPHLGVRFIVSIHATGRSARSCGIVLPCCRTYPVCGSEPPQCPLQQPQRKFMDWQGRGGVFCIHWGEAKLELAHLRTAMSDTVAISAWDGPPN
jgi:hypothetical protein